MTQEHPITPSEELVRDWLNNMRSDDCIGAYPHDMDLLLATQAARRGADQELEACCEHLKRIWAPSDTIDSLRAARRLKPPSLKEQALAALAEADGADYPVICTTLTADQHALIRRALEELDD